MLFIDEVHRLPRTVEEILYPAMEDFALDIITGKGQMAASYHLPLPRFTLVGATTRAGQLSAPLRDRFGVVLRLELYSPQELGKIVTRSAQILGADIDADAALEIASRSRGTPRIANRLLKRVRDFAEVMSGGRITLNTAKIALDRMEIDELGLDASDRSMLTAIIQNYGGGPVGLETLGGGHRGRGGDHRGRKRALPDADWLFEQDPTGPLRHGFRLPAPGLSRAGEAAGGAAEAGGRVTAQDRGRKVETTCARRSGKTMN